MPAQEESAQTPSPADQKRQAGLVVRWTIAHKGGTDVESGSGSGGFHRKMSALTQLTGQRCLRHKLHLLWIFSIVLAVSFFVHVVYNEPHRALLNFSVFDWRQLEDEAIRLKTCQPKSHIVFLKTHKTASSTVQNILFRYGESRELIFALPPKKTHMMFYPSPFSSNFVERKHLTKFDIMCAHMRFRKSEVEKVMPNDSFYFSIMRHPVPSLESTFQYYHGMEVFRNFKTLDDFLDKGKNEKSLNDVYAHNNLAFDFGYNNTVTADTSDLETIVSKVIAGIEQEFHLILITEYFDESMILLKHALCWSLEDIVSFKVNSRAHQSHLSLSPMTPEKIRRWNVLDWRIYEHFNATFWQKVRNVVGEEKMKLEVSELRKLQAKLIGTCLDGGHAVDPQLIKDNALKPYQPPGAIVQGFNLKPDLDNQTYKMCQRMATPEVVYTLHLYKKQFENPTKAITKYRQRQP